MAGKTHTHNNDFFSCLNPDQRSHVIISGPCSAESEEQVFETAKQLKKTGLVQIFRAGLWKPRTRPSSFIGVGEAGIPWLKRVEKELSLPVCTEIALPEHAEFCMKAGLHIFWIGARTVSNPFSVQSLADALKGTSVCVLIKNPLNPDSELWVGAIERMQKAGIKNIAAIHRGFYPFERTTLRNIPKWELAIELKSTFPGIPVICDVSHMAGNKTYLKDIAQKALDLNMDGLMLESHCCPEKALSDAKQQITPGQLQDLVKSLEFRQSYSDNIEFKNHLEQLRAQVDSIDAQVIELLTSRMKLVEKIGMYKKANNIAIVQVRRWNEIMSTSLTRAKKSGLSTTFLSKVLGAIHQESIRKQTVIFKRKK
jgi:chorismate mutase